MTERIYCIWQLCDQFICMPKPPKQKFSLNCSFCLQQERSWYLAAVAKEGMCVKLGLNFLFPCLQLCESVCKILDGSTMAFEKYLFTWHTLSHLQFLQLRNVILSAVLEKKDCSWWRRLYQSTAIFSQMKFSQPVLPKFSFIARKISDGKKYSLRQQNYPMAKWDVHDLCSDCT